jgi:hypothetical protein
VRPLARYRDVAGRPKGARGMAAADMIILVNRLLSKLVESV